MSDRSSKESSRASASEAPQKRELEQAPQLVRKAASVLLVGALTPWLSSMSTSGEMPWKFWLGAVALTALAGWLLMECAKAHAGLKANGLAKSIAGAHPMAPTIASVVVFIGAVVVCFLGSSIWRNGEFVGTNPDPELIFEGAKNTFSIFAALEMGTLFLAFATLAHVMAYEYGGKFNPIFPLMFLGPAIAGSLQAVKALTKFGDHGLVIVSLGGSLIVAAGGVMAMYTMFVSMKQAKIEGEIKAAQRREERKRERAARREQSQG